MKKRETAEINEVLSEFLALEHHERSSYLSKDNLDPEVRMELEVFADLEHRLDGFMSATAAGLLPETIGDAVDHKLIGSMIGPFEITKELNRGGMGAVFLAERRDKKFEQRVAIKVLRLELNSVELRESFQREIKIQSRLFHPHIAAIIDAGTTDSGLPYIVMEYVDGRPIDRFCLEEKLALVDVLKLFNKVCDAVTFAHGKLVVHRDLKPGNILITTDRSPKLLDFGISELVADDGGSASRRSILGITPNYSSPEQLAGETVGTSADIYSLGIILRKLLNGRQVPEVESIVEKATDNNAEKRYSTAEQLKADIWRFIDGFPVHARQDSVWYRLKKHLMRRRLAIAAGAIVLISLIVGTIVAVWQARAAQAQAAAAHAEQLKSEKISKFMFRVLAYANPRWYAEGASSNGNARVIDAMLDLSDKIDAEFANEPDVAAELHHRFAEVLLSYPEQIDRTRFHLSRALELRRSYYGEHHELVAKDMFYYSVGGLVDSDKRAEYLLDAMDMMRETNPDNLNLPYMVEDYVSRMFLPKYKNYNGQFSRVLTERTGQDHVKVAEDRLLDADRVFKLHYGLSSPAIRLNFCRLAYVQFRLEKIAESAASERLCRTGPPDPSTSLWLDELEQEKAADEDR
jgi:serine/threonine protein kinase